MTAVGADTAENPSSSLQLERGVAKSTERPAKMCHAKHKRSVRHEWMISGRDSSPQNFKFRVEAGIGMSHLLGLLIATIITAATAVNIKNASSPPLELEPNDRGMRQDITKTYRHVN